jgi:hypothetical protein
VLHRINPDFAALNPGYGTTGLHLDNIAAFANRGMKRLLGGRMSVDCAGACGETKINP